MAAVWCSCRSLCLNTGSESQQRQAHNLPQVGRAGHGKQQGSLFGHGDRDKRIKIRNFIRFFEPSRAESAAVVQSVLGSAQDSQLRCCFGCVVAALCRFVSPDNNRDNAIASGRFDRQRTFHRL